MHFLKKFFGKDEKFYDLLEESAMEAHASTVLLSDYLKTFAQAEHTKTTDDFSLSRKKDKRITQKITEELCRTFVTPIEREDIEALSIALYRIPKIVEKIVSRISIFPGKLPMEGFLRQSELLQRAANEVAVMVRQLRKGCDLKAIKRSNDLLQHTEGEADKVMQRLLQVLYQDSSYDAKETMILQEMYELMEKAIDRCRDAGNVVFQIVLKYS